MSFLVLAIILMGKRELVALLIVSSWCLVIVVWLFLAVQGLSTVCDCGISWSYSLTIYSGSVAKSVTCLATDVSTNCSVDELSRFPNFRGYMEPRNL